MKNRVGSPVEGEDFFDRENEIASMWRALDGGNLLLLAPRRVGKTSLMKRLVHLAPGQGYQALYLTVEGAVDEADFVQRLYRAVAEHHPDQVRRLLNRSTGGVLGSFLGRIKKVGAMGVSVELDDEARRNWRDTIEALGAMLARLDSRWLLAIDELPLFTLKLLRADPSGERAANFLHNLRELRQNQPSLRWLLAGSIGLDTVTSRYNLADAINDLRVTSLGPFAGPGAEAFLQSLATSYDMDLYEPVRQHLLQRLEWLLPYYLQLLFSELLDRLAGDSRPPTVDDIDALFEGLLQPANKNYFDYWRQRLHEELGSPDDAIATTVLSAACREPAGASRTVLMGALSQHLQDPDQREQRLRYLLDILINDGYLLEADGRFRFRFPLLREYWARRVAP
ncbi:MAG: AAA family ATPase [Gammaproteobacteria bacterium]